MVYESEEDIGKITIVFLISFAPISFAKGLLLITSIICLPGAVLIIIKSAEFISLSMPEILLIAATALFMTFNLKFAHKIMEKVNAGNNPGGR